MSPFIKTAEGGSATNPSESLILDCLNDIKVGKSDFFILTTGKMTFIQVGKVDGSFVFEIQIDNLENHFRKYVEMKDLPALAHKIFSSISHLRSLLDREAGWEKVDLQGKGLFPFWIYCLGLVFVFSLAWKLHFLVATKIVGFVLLTILIFDTVAGIFYEKIKHSVPFSLMKSIFGVLSPAVVVLTYSVLSFVAAINSDNPFFWCAVGIVLFLTGSLFGFSQWFYRPAFFLTTEKVKGNEGNKGGYSNNRKNILFGFIFSIFWGLTLVL